MKMSLRKSVNVFYLDSILSQSKLPRDWMSHIVEKRDIKNEYKMQCPLRSLESSRDVSADMDINVQMEGRDA